MLKDRDSDIIRRIQAGETYEAIGQRYGLTRARIHRIGRDAGVTSSRRAHWGPGLTEDQRAAAIPLILRGMPFVHIGEQMGVSGEVIRNVAIRYCGYMPKSRGDEWSKKEINRLKTLYRKPGWSAARIAAKIGRPRSAVIGKAYRLGLAGSAA